MLHRVLIVDDNPDLRADLRRVIEKRRDCEIQEASNEDEARACLKTARFSVVVTDVDLSEDGGTDSGGLDVLATARHQDPTVQVIVVTSHIRSDLPKQVRMMGGLSVVWRWSSSYLDLFDREMGDALWRSQEERAKGPGSLSIFVPPGCRGDLRFRLEPGHGYPKRGQPLSLDADGIKHAAASFNTMAIQGVDLSTYNAAWKSLGLHLWHELFETQPQLLIALGQARPLSMKSVPLPIRFVFESHDALDVPFELLHDGADFVARGHPVLRSFRAEMPSAERMPALLSGLKETKQPLRVLLIASNTLSAWDESIRNVDVEVSRIEGVFRDHAVSRFFPKLELEVLHSWDASHGAVEERLRGGLWHIVHYAGHGHHNSRYPGDSALFFWERPCRQGDWEQHLEKRDLSGLVARRGEPRALTADDLSRYWSSTPSLVYLSCCLSGRNAAKTTLTYSNALGLVDALSQKGVPDLVGHSWPLLDDDDTIRFVTTFYDQLLWEFSPEQAMLRARQSAPKHAPIWASAVLVTQGA